MDPGAKRLKPPKKDPDFFGSLQPNEVFEKFTKSNPRRLVRYALSKI